MPGLAEAIRAYGAATGVPDGGAVPRRSRASPAARWWSTCRVAPAGCATGSPCSARCSSTRSTRSHGGDHSTRRSWAGPGLAGDLHEGDVGLRPIRLRDRAAWRDARQRNADWLRPWDATLAGRPGATSHRRFGHDGAGRCRREARRGPRDAVRRDLPRRARRAGDRRRHHLGLAAVRRTSATGSTSGSPAAASCRPRWRWRPTTASGRRAAPGRDQHPAGERRVAAGSSRSSGSATRGCGRATCTSTAHWRDHLTFALTPRGGRDRGPRPVAPDQTVDAGHAGRARHALGQSLGAPPRAPTVARREQRPHLRGDRGAVAGRSGPRVAAPARRGQRVPVGSTGSRARCGPCPGADPTGDRREVWMPRGSSARAVPDGAVSRAERRRRGAAYRRRRTGLVLTSLTLLVAALSVVHVLPRWAALVPLVVLLVFVVEGRRPLAKARERELAARRRRAARARRARTLARELAGEPYGIGLDDRRVVEPATAAVVRAGARRRHPGAARGRRRRVLRRRGPAGWDPVPVPLPTYVSAPKAPRSVRVIDLTLPGAWTSGHLERDPHDADVVEAPKATGRRPTPRPAARHRHRRGPGRAAPRGGRLTRRAPAGESGSLALLSSGPVRGCGAVR